MKLRIRGNSVRLRLSPSEVDRLAREGGVEEATIFGPGQRIVYGLRADTDARGVAATWIESRLTVVLPWEAALQWATGEEAGIRGEQPLPGGGVLKLLVEKDFECLDARDDEEPAEAYPHPARQTGGACAPA